MGAFPFTESAQFDTSPALVHTGLRNRRLLDKHCRRAAGSYRSGDTVFLCTDALAAWFLAQAERGAEPWTTWRRLADAEAFREWTAAERSAGPDKRAVSPLRAKARPGGRRASLSPRAVMTASSPVA